MRKLIIALIASTQLFTSAPEFIVNQHPVPPAVRDADRQTNNAPMEAPAPRNANRINPRQLQAEAAELAQLSAGIPGRIDYVNKGQMPKDLNDQLKRIEKLAKHMRGEIYP
jgi:hypothetical protein